MKASIRFSVIRIVCLVLTMFVMPDWWSQALAGETVTYFHNDPAGTPMTATDVNGLQVWEETYYPYGEQLVDAPAAASNELWFAGAAQDESTGLSYLGARYYHPVLGRFMGVDPLSGSLGNRYAYANNNPYRFIDPTGLDADSIERRPDHAPGNTGWPVKESSRTRISPAEDYVYAPFTSVTEEPLRGGFSDLLRQLIEWTNLPPYVTEDGREVPFVAGMPPLPGAIGRVGALRQLVAGQENIRRFASLNEARAAARQYAGLGDDAVNFVQEIGPLSGRVTGRMSRDGLRGWRIDFDPKKGFHVNWWDRTGGVSRANWRYGANVIEGGTVDDFWAIMQHFP